MYSDFIERIAVNPLHRGLVWAGVLGPTHVRKSLRGTISFPAPSTRFMAPHVCSPFIFKFSLSLRQGIHRLEREKGRKEEEMFGRVRPSSSSLDSLERPPPKIFKDDSLSIYEATLLKLKLGAKHDLSSHSEVAAEIQGNCASLSLPECLSDAPNLVSSDIMKKQLTAPISPNGLAIMDDIDYSSANTSPSSGDYQSTRSLKQNESRDLSVAYLFSKYRSLQHSQRSSSEEAMIIESDNCSGSISQISGLLDG